MCFMLFLLYFVSHIHVRMWQTTMTEVQRIHTDVASSSFQYYL